MHPEAFYGRPWALQAGAGMHYTTYTGASYDLYPEIVQHIPVLIYNGDVDACVPYNSNADWIDSMVTMQGYRVAEPWRPWMLDRGGGARPALRRAHACPSPRMMRTASSPSVSTR